METGTRVDIHRHAAECPACRALLVAAVRSEGVPSDAPLESSWLGGRMQVLGGSWKPPTEVDEFRLVRLLGRGGMGAVYLAHDTSLDRHVALKLSIALQPDTHTLESFAVEARAIARIKHPNVVTVFRAGEVQGRPYLVYEYVDGKSLAELRLPLPWRYVLDIAVGLARGLCAAHQRGVLHRDLKPGNAILDTDGTVKLLDFGLAAFVEAELRMPRAAPGVAGTPRYLAPELWSGAEATPQSDLYALGLLLYELCTGGLPRTPGPLSRMPGALEPLGRCGALVERVPGMDPEFAQAIERCLAEDPQQRFTRAEVLCGVLERLRAPGADPAFAAPRPEHGARPWGAQNML
ncbi:serine/threonine protein kinase [Myxococcus stipitatus DSM 14675]|uniref:Serine/threonine protein kinase n=1 Tax=Myxococcus stipitatus (strain DSM 14675 / JCM 12634 / Mx s8) TaxID=1278073 RepID=L7UMJ0_MYXSD|nr:serine/threonine protein kinase [Myxococcus stipitatus DSM 14675]